MALAAEDNVRRRKILDALERNLGERLDDNLEARPNAFERRPQISRGLAPWPSMVLSTR